MTIASDGRNRTTVLLPRGKDRRLVLAMGSGPTTTAWLSMFWHAAFALLVIAFTKDDDTPLVWGLFVAVAALAVVLGLAEPLRETLDKR